MYKQREEEGYSVTKLSLQSYLWLKNLACRTISAKFHCLQEDACGIGFVFGNWKQKLIQREEIKSMDDFFIVTESEKFLDLSQNRLVKGTARADAKVV